MDSTEDPAVPAIRPNQPAPVATKICPSCNAELLKTAVVCPKCGSAVAKPAKDKTVAILLAVFLLFWTWLYTYQVDKTKFWIGLGLCVLGALTAIFLVGDVIIFGVWIWSIVTVAKRPQSWYSDFGLNN